MKLSHKQNNVEYQISAQISLPLWRCGEIFSPTILMVGNYNNDFSSPTVETVGYNKMIV